MRLYNTKSQSVEELKPIHPGKVSMYVCGPTVYNHAHIGNARPIVVFDLLKRVLEADGYAVTLVSNYTDVDDKIIQKAQEEKVDERVITGRYIDAYEKIRNQLGARQPDETPRVTHTIPEIIAFIEALVLHDKAYVVNGNVYFRVSSDPDYGTLSHQHLDQLEIGARIDENPEKENPLDFVLWKKTDEGVRWASPWGEGRPGWHTECVVMIQDAFGGLIDIHGGGMDLRFPHHENERAQCEVLYHRDLANLWVHNAMLNINQEKMSKSLGNVILAKDLIEQLGGDVVRWLLLAVHYRLILNISEDTVEQASKAIQKLRQAMRPAYVRLSLLDYVRQGSYDQATFADFLAQLNDDLNTPNAMMVLDQTIKTLNQSLRQRPFMAEALDRDLTTVEKMLDVLGITRAELVLSDAQKALYQQWEQAKQAKDFVTADQLRTSLQKQGIL